MGLEAVEVPETPTKTSTPTALAPGFRFHPTDEELVIYYLKRKVFGKPFRFNAISEVDIYKSEPWDLAGKSSLKSRDQEYYFFSALDKKYGNGARMNRATNQGYWKATGNDRPVKHDSRTVGMKKTLVFHSGRAPDGKRTNWVMHEYRLIEAELETAGGVGGIQDAFVLCRVFHKSNIGPPSGQRYAPFIEEDWDDGKLTVVPGMETVDEPIAGRGQDACIEGNNNHLRCIEGNAHGPNVEGNAHDPNVAGKNTDQDTHSINKAPLSTLGLPRDNQLVLSMCKIERMDDHALPCVVNTEERLDDHPSPRLDDHPSRRLDDHPSRRLDDHPSPGVDDEQHLPCMENRLTLPLLKYKRRRQNEFNSEYSNVSENSSRTTQDRCSSTTTTAATTTTMPIRTIPTTKNFLSALVEYSLLESFEPKDSAPVPPPDLDAANLNSSVPPSYLKFIQDLQNEIHKISLERETLKFEMTSAQAMINILQSRIDLLNKENEDLKRSIRDRK